MNHVSLTFHEYYDGRALEHLAEKVSGEWNHPGFLRYPARRHRDFADAIEDDDNVLSCEHITEYEFFNGR